MVLTVSANYPAAWLSWVRQQVRVGVAVELNTSRRSVSRHLHRLPVVVDSNLDGVLYLRRLIHSCAESMQGGAAGDKWDAIAERVLADPAVTPAPPQLGELIAWRIAQFPGSNIHAGNGDEDPELDCEGLAKFIVASGWVRPSWAAPAAANPVEQPTGQKTPQSRQRRRLASDGQLSLYPA